MFKDSNVREEDIKLLKFQNIWVRVITLVFLKGFPMLKQTDTRWLSPYFAIDICTARYTTVKLYLCSYYKQCMW